MIECPTADALQIFAALAKRSVDACARLRQFLDAKPVIASLEIDSAATMRAGHVVYRDESSQQLLDALAAAIAADDQRNAFCGSEGYNKHPDLVEAFYLRKSAESR